LKYEDTLQSLERLVESFLERALDLKENRLAVLDGMNRLDDLAQACRGGSDVSPQVSEWFEEHHSWLSEGRFRPGDVRRVERMLSEIEESVKAATASSDKERIDVEIERWRETSRSAVRRMTLKRGPEQRSEQVPADSITQFGRLLARTSGLFVELSGDKKHLMSTLNKAIEIAAAQKSNEALLLSACIIYYLKQNGYKVEPYVKRLREAEKQFTMSGNRV